MTIYAKILAIISSADLLLTVTVIKWYGAVETGPVLNWYYVSYGILGLIFAKLWFNSLTILSLELGLISSPKEQRKIKLGYVLGITIYMIAYLVPSLIFHWELFFRV